MASEDCAFFAGFAGWRMPRPAGFAQPAAPDRAIRLLGGRRWRARDGSFPAPKSLAMILTSPEYYNAHTTREQVFAAIEKSKDHYAGPDANNKIRQMEAMMSLDAANSSAVKAKMFIVVAKNDHTVTPEPALEFAKKIGAEHLIFDNPCGHSIHACPDNGMGQAILKFLAQ